MDSVCLGMHMLCVGNGRNPAESLHSKKERFLEYPLGVLQIETVEETLSPWNNLKKKGSSNNPF